MNVADYEQCIEYKIQVKLLQTIKQEYTECYKDVTKKLQR